jgi:hypothetical protein
MQVRLMGFQLLSADLPANLPDTVDAEITAAFNVDGVVGVSNAATPAAGDAPAYGLGGTIQRDGDTIRVITRMVNERSGATLWSDTFNYDGNEVARVPRHIAVDKGNVVRCGLFGASTYYKPLPDAVLRDYMQFCQVHWSPLMNEGRKALLPAQRVVAAVLAIEVERDTISIVMDSAHALLDESNSVFGYGEDETGARVVFVVAQRGIEKTIEPLTRCLDRSKLVVESSAPEQRDLDADLLEAAQR